MNWFIIVLLLHLLRLFGFYVVDVEESDDKHVPGHRSRATSLSSLAASRTPDGQRGAWYATTAACSYTVNNKTLSSFSNSNILFFLKAGCGKSYHLNLSFSSLFSFISHRPTAEVAVRRPTSGTLIIAVQNQELRTRPVEPGVYNTWLLVLALCSLRARCFPQVDVTLKDINSAKGVLI